MKNLGKFFASSVLGVALLSAGPVMAQDNGQMFWNQNISRHQRMDNGDQMSFHRIFNRNRDMRRIDFNRPRVSMRMDNNFFNQNRVFLERFRLFQDHRPDMMFARRIVLVDRDNPIRTIEIRNSNTGPFSVNTIRVLTSDEFFNRVVNRIDVDQNVNISVNTGDNTISFNTVVGDISTGDVNISIQ